MKIGVLINFKPWVFVQTSFKHVSHALISKLLSFIGNFDYGSKFLRIWGFCEIGQNWVTLVNVIDKLSNYNFFLYMLCCSNDQYKDFWELGFSKLGIFYNS